MYRRCKGKPDRIMRLVHENLLGVRVIRAFNREEKKFSRLGEDTEALNQAQQKVSGLSGAMNPYYICDCGMWRSLSFFMAGN